MGAFLLTFPFFCELVSDLGTFKKLSKTNLLKGLARAGGSIEIDPAVRLLKKFLQYFDDKLLEKLKTVNSEKCHKKI